MKKLKIIGLILLVVSLAFLMSGCGDITCPNCDGSGKCDECYGQGYTIRHNYDYYTYTVEEIKEPCYICNGSGVCQTCKGTGKVNLINMMGSGSDSDSSSSDSNY